MQTFPYLLSGTADDLLTAQRRASQATREPWSLDWDRLVLVCPHGHTLSPWTALRTSSQFIATLSERLHGKPSLEATPRRR